MKGRAFSYAFFASAMLAFLVSCGDVKHSGQEIVRHGKYIYCGGVSQGKFNGYGVLYVGDSVVYEGEWRNGKRNGTGFSRDSLGRTIKSTWRCDTIVSGVRSGSGEVYAGEFLPNGTPNGHGTLTTATEYYDGYWLSGKADGFGFSATAEKLRLGEWKSGRYLGEKLTYTSQRIYGIDISRFQHDVGRRRYSINWSEAKITHLGSLSKKRISGKVNYPISFCFIKSTEGTTVRNRYFRSDYRAARKKGIKCGAYHFFSTRTGGRQQAAFFVKNTIFSDGDFPPVLDIEPSHKQIAAMGGAEKMFDEVRAWCEYVERKVGVRPILYVSQSFVNRYLPSAPDIMHTYDFWIARYGEYKPDLHLVFWQLSPDGKVAGIKSEVDINVFNGYADQFALYKQRRLIKK